MINTTSHWTRAELKAYILLFCAHADLHESGPEAELIKTKVGKDRYEKVHSAFDKDNDFQRIEKIKHKIKSLGYTPEDLKGLYREIQEVFFADGVYDHMEQHIFRSLKRILEN